MDELTRKLYLLVSNGQDASLNSRLVLSSKTSGGGHGVAQCPIVSLAIAPMEQVDYIGGDQRNQNNPYSNTYNPRWRSQPNFF